MAGEFRRTCLDTSGVKASEGRCLIIGEVAQTHDGSLGLAHAFVDAIAKAGADAVKFQTHIAEAESRPDEPWRVKFSRQDETRYEYWKRMEFSAAQWAGLKAHAEELGLLFLSSPFSVEAFDLLTGIGTGVWKVASGEIGNTVLLDRMIGTGAPMILSSGMSSWEELDAAVKAVRKNGNAFALLQCTSAYPCPPEKTGLNLLDEFRSRFGCPVGLSDHSGSIYAGLAAAALGAEVLELHVTLSREMFGPDVPASVTNTELAEMVRGVRVIEKMIANPVDKAEMAVELEPLREIFTKSICAGSALAAGTTVTEEHLRLKKPGGGLPVSEMGRILGRRLKKDVRKDEYIFLEDVEG